MVILPILLIILKIVLISSKCRMTQKCDLAPKKCGPINKIDSEPQILLGPNVNSTCPEYYGQLACCNNDQNILMSQFYFKK